MLRGMCLCGAVRYAVEDDFRYAMNCHCGKCRRTTGSAFKPMGGIAVGKLTLHAAPGDVLHYGDDRACDIHCRHCGSLLYSIVREGRFAHVAYGTLLDPPSRRPDHHIMVAFKAPWHDITDDLPQHQGFP